MLRVKKRRWLLAAAVLPLVLAACTSTTGHPGAGTGATGMVAGSGPAAPGGPRAVRHVWVIELENQGYAQSFGTPSADPYLASTLPRTGALLENYYAIGHSSADNYIAQVSGQAPNIATQIDCPVWTPFPGQVIAGPYHQVLGEGCVYPEAVPTLGNQLSAAGRREGRRGGPLAATPPPGPSTTPRRPQKATSTPPATTGSRSSGRSPPTRPSAPRTSCRSGRCRATWPGPPPPRRSPSSRRTCATTATMRRASPAPPAGSRKPTRSWRSGCPRSWPRPPTGTAASS